MKINLLKSGLLFTFLVLIVGGVSPAWAQKALPYEYGFEDNNLATDGWTALNPGNNNKSKFIISTAAKKTGSYGFQFSSYDSGTANQLLISPELSTPSGVAVTFAYKNSKSGSSETFKIGYSTTDTDTESFTWVDNLSESEAVWKTYEQSFPAGTKYIAINYTNYYQYYLYVDDFVFEAPATCIAPNGLTTDNITSNSVQLSWISDADAWNVQYKKFSDSDWTDVNGTVTSNPYTLTELLPATSYQARVRTYCDASDQSKWTNAVSFTTDCATITEFPFTETFNGLSSGIPACWDNSEGTTTDNSYKWNSYITGYDGKCVRFNSFNNRDGITNVLKTPVMNLPSDKTMQLSFWYMNPTGGDFSVYISADGGSTYTTALATGLTGQSSWKEMEINIPAEFKDNVVFVFKGTSNCGTGDAYIYLDEVTIKEARDEAKLSVETQSIEFGMTSTASQEIVIENKGTAQMTAVSVIYTATTGADDAITITPALSDTTIDASDSKTITVAVNTAKTGAFSGTITITATDQKTVEIPVSGYTVGEDVFYEDFSGNALPDGWENTGWTFSNKTAVAATNKLLTTPSLTVAEGETMAIRLKRGTGFSTPELFYSLDGGSTKSANLAGSSLTSEYTIIYIEGIEAGNYYITLDGYNVIIDAIAGFKLNPNAPKFGIYSNEDCTTSVSGNTANANFGFVAESEEAKFYFRNDGTGTLNLSVGETPTGFSAALDKTTLAKSEVATLTVTILDDTKGYREGEIAVTAEGLGTFTVNASGLVRDAEKVYVDFTADDAKFPAGWNQDKWTIFKGYTEYTTTDESSTIQTTKLIADAGEKLLIEAKNNSLGWRYPAALSYSYSRDNGETWSEAKDLTGCLSSTDYTQLMLDDIADAESESTVIVRLTGKNVAIRRIYGFKQPNAAIMTTDAADYNFGMQTAAAVKVFTVKNEGFVDLTNLTATLETGTDYTVAVDKTTLGPNEETTITVTQEHSLDNLGAHSDVLTISADGQTDVIVNLSGKTRDDSKLYVDFEDGTTLPTDWTIGESWRYVSSDGNRYICQSNYSNATSIVTSPLTVAEGEKLTFQAGRYIGSTAPIMKVRYSVDGGVTWSDYVDYASQILTTTFIDLELADVPAGKAIIEILARYVKLDNIAGFAVGAEMPVVILTKDNALVEKIDGAFPAIDFGTVNDEQTAVYTLKNNGTADLVSTIATTGDVTAAVTGEGITIAGDKLTLAAGNTATITVTMAAEAPFGEKAGKLTITSEGGVGTVEIDFTANMIDPTLLFVDFEDNAWPAGWYHASSWSITSSRTPLNYYAHNTSSSVADLITQKLHVASADDILTFKAKNYSTFSSANMKLYSSADRIDWTELAIDAELNATEFKTIEVKGLEAGDYYLKIASDRLCVDDFTGWHKVDMPHDLYVTASNIPTGTKVPETSITATATVTSLITTETDVYAQLFFDDTVVATATAASIAKNGTKAFTMTGKVPAEEGTYNARIVVYYSDNSVAFTTATTQVEVAHTRALNVTAFTRTSEENVEADADNKFTATFEVTVQNTGTVDLTKEQVSISVTDSEGNPYETVTAAESLAKDAETTLQVTVTTSALEGGLFTFKAKENLNNTTFATAQTVNVTAAAPKFELTAKDGDAVSDGEAVNFGLVREATTKTYTITNSGLKPLELVSIVAPEGYTATEVTEENKTIAVGGTLDIDVTLKAAQGKKTGMLVFTYMVDAETSKTFTLNLDGHSIAEDTWVETFDTEISGDWTTDGWIWKDDRQAAYSDYLNYEKYLLSPRLAAKAGEELNFDVDFTYSGYSLKAEYSTDRSTWTEIDTYDYAQRGTKTFTAPADGNYYLRFTATRYALIDNLIGFRLNKPEHEIEIASSTVPTTGTQYADYTATVRLKENLNKSEEVTAKLYVDGKEVAKTTETIAAKATATVSITWEPQEAITTAVDAHIEISYAGGTLTTAPVSLTISTPYELDEEEGEVIAGTYPSLLLKRTFAAGWNTICLPFDVNAADMESLFGEGTTIYSFSGYVDGSLNFKKTYSLTSGTPYIIYVRKAISQPVIVRNVSIASFDTTPSYTYQNGATFQGTYAPMAAGSMEGKYSVTTKAKIAKGTATDTMKGFRAYFELSEDADAYLTFFESDGTTKILVVEPQKETNTPAYNLNGQRVETLKKGNLYIINNKKQIRR